MSVPDLEFFGPALGWQPGELKYDYRLRPRPREWSGECGYIDLPHPDRDVVLHCFYLRGEGFIQVNGIAVRPKRLMWATLTRLNGKVRAELVEEPKELSGRDYLLFGAGADDEEALQSLQRALGEHGVACRVQAVH